jgi:hypothetical protein
MIVHVFAIAEEVMIAVAYLQDDLKGDTLWHS